MIRLSQFKTSLLHAFRGMRVVFQTEQSFRLQIVTAIGVVVAATWFQVRVYEWIVLLLLIGTVLSLELINSIFERMVDLFKPRLHPMVKDVKDIMAAAVLVMSVLSLVVGLIIFWPYLNALVSLE